MRPVIKTKVLTTPSSDEIQRSVESTFPVHVLPVFSLLRNINRKCFNRSILLLALWRLEGSKAHQFHHLDFLFCLSLHVLSWYLMDLCWLFLHILPVIVSSVLLSQWRQRGGAVSSRRSGSASVWRTWSWPSPVSVAGPRPLTLPAPPLTVTRGRAWTASLSSRGCPAPASPHYYSCME